MNNNYKFFRNKDCEYFPCHKVKNDEKFNCLFCYCPLYFLSSVVEMEICKWIKDCQSV